MAKYKITTGQNLFDIALHIYGSIEGIVDLMINNPSLSLCDKLKTGDELLFTDGFVINADVVAYNKLHGITPANGERNVYYKTSPLPRIAEIIIKNTQTTASFTISGDGMIEIDWGDKPINQSEGYALVSHIVKEFGKKANLLLDGYNTAQKDAIASNLDVYRKGQADAKFVSVTSIFQDYITELVRQGKSSAEAQKILRDKLNVPSKEDVSNNYLRKDGKLSDLVLANADAKKLACRTLGAAYADEYQTKLADTGWLQMSNSGGSTDTRQLFIRQIGNVVCIQGIINTGKRDGNNWGGIVAIIPNQISPPKYGLKTSAQEFNNDHKYNRGTTFVLRGNSRNIVLYESGYNNIDTEINFTYMT